MPRVNDIYSIPVGSEGVPNATISSTTYNNLIHDIELDLNRARPIVAGGTGATNAADARLNLGITDEIAAASVPQCGRLYFSDANTLAFIPYNGDKIKIQGKIYSIGNGIVGTRTNCFRNSVAGQTLSPSTVYLVTMFNNGGTLAMDFLTTLAHSADSTAGNIGVETSTANKSRTVIGLIQTMGDGTFQNTVAMRTVISWFNRRNLNVRGASTAGSGTTSGSPVDVNAAARAFFLTWADDDVQFSITGAFLSTAPGVGGWQIGLDGAPIGLVSNQSVNSATHWGAVATHESFNTTETTHFVAPLCAGYGVTMNFHVAVVGMIRG